ncbi:MAG: hypothetical protein IKK09_06785 [Clostridia bacterium]|nr:hypothetical protein [Clostridia bacterium]
MQKMQKKFATDFIWSIAALVTMNGVLQLFVYPLLNRHLGEAAFGNVLYVLGIVAVFAPSVGLAANNIRLVESRERQVLNGDSLLAMLPLLAVSGIIFFAVCNGYFVGVSDYIMAALLIVLTTLRYYGDVEYRMTLNYKGYFVYYLVLSFGYVIGALLYPLTKSWLLCFLLGEATVWLLLVVKGHIYKPLKKSENTVAVSRKVLVLAASYLLVNMVLNLDRVLLQHLIDSSTVTVYYVASLLGKTAALLVGPLNGVVIGHLTKGKTKPITKKSFAIVSGAVLLVGAVLFAGISIVMPLFVKLLYPDIYLDVLSVSTLANLSQIICFASSLLLTIMLTFCSERWQFAIQLVYAVIFLGLSVLFTNSNGLQGFVIASLAANTLRLVFTVGAGLAILVKKEKTQAKE